ncbi:hypothetical protein [Aeoliella sp.]|uniref:hypothetical protein n=1 Tax=Aeoliella sp. TaxID=2795800 RepID=UPI003CCC075C
MTSASQKNLRIYLSDHLALIAGEVELAKRVRRENRETPLSSYLCDYLEALDRQQPEIRRVLSTLGGHPSRLKQAGSWMVEKLGRLKLNGSLLHYTDLSRVLELEALLLLATARRSMLRTLEAAKIEGFDFGAAGAELDDHITTLEEHLKSARHRALA